MGILRLIGIFPGLLLRSFLPWYFAQRPAAIVRSYGACTGAALEILSIPFLLRTLFSPWKSIMDEYPSNLMNLGMIAQVFTLNCTTRSIGFLFRIVALAVALAMQIALLLFFLAYLLLWIVYPFLLFLAGAFLFSIL